MAAYSGTFAAPGVSASPGFTPYGNFNLSLWVDAGLSFGATVQLERQFITGAWLPVTYTDGTVLAWTGPVSTTLTEYEGGVAYRLNCTDFAAGPINFRISQ